MTESETPKAAGESVPAPPNDAPPKSELFALGCGCLLTILIFGAAAMIGFSRG